VSGVAPARRLRLAVMASGGGSNLGAILDACRSGRISAEVVVVISDKAAARALTRASDVGIPALPIPPEAGETRDSHGERLLAALRPFDADLVVLAGYMRILSTAFVQRLSGRMVNIHPSLLPRHKGLHTHRRALEAGEPEHGCTVPVLPGDDETALAARVLAREHVIYPKVIGWIAAGRLRCPDGVPMLDGRPLTAPLIDDGSLA
jgi:phosphoribosylglycinamide formyltransferase-1